MIKWPRPKTGICCHNPGMMVGDGHGSWKTESGHLQGVVTERQLYLILGETESSAAESFISKQIRRWLAGMISLFGCLNLASYIAFLPESDVRLKSTEEKMNWNFTSNIFFNILPSLSFILLTCSNSKQVASMCQIAHMKVAKSLMPIALLPSARCQVPEPSVPSLHLPGIEMSRLKTNSFKQSSSKASTHPFPFSCSLLSALVLKAFTQGILNNVIT